MKFLFDVADTLQIIKRNVKRNFRLPQLLVFSSIQPVMFLLLFNFVFGGAVRGTGAVKYINFLLPGIFAQTSMFGAIQTGVGLAEDLGKGVIDRLRSLPIARFAVLAGRTLADSTRNILVLLLMTGVGTLLGFRATQGVGHFIVALGVILFFAFAMSWISAMIGLALKESESVQAAGFMLVFPLMFASSVFVPVDTMPHWLQVFARNQPVTQVVNAVRYLTRGGPSVSSVWHALAWSLGIILIFAPLSVWRYKKIQ